MKKKKNRLVNKGAKLDQKNLKTKFSKTNEIGSQLINLVCVQNKIDMKKVQTKQKMVQNLIIPTEKVNFIQKQDDLQNNKTFFVDSIEQLAEQWMNQWNTQTDNDSISDFNSDSENVDFVFQEENQNQYQLRFIQNTQKSSQDLDKSINLIELLNLENHPILKKYQKYIVKNFICNICGQQFSTGCSLGGHISKKHPKDSQKKHKNKKIFKANKKV